MAESSYREPGLSEFFAQTNKVDQRKQRRLISEGRVGQKEGIVTQRRKLESLKNHRVGIYALPPTRLKQEMASTFSLKPALDSASDLIRLDGGEFMNQQVLELAALSNKNDQVSKAVQADGELDIVHWLNHGYFNVETRISHQDCKRFTDLHLECYELILRFLTYYQATVASDNQFDAGIDNATFVEYMLSKPVLLSKPLETLKSYSAMRDHLEGAFCADFGECNSETCSLLSFPVNSKFFSSLGQRLVTATSSVYLCCESGRIHVCSGRHCPWVRMLPTGEGWKCPATQLMTEDVLVSCGQKAPASDFHKIVMSLQQPGDSASTGRGPPSVEYLKKRRALAKAQSKRLRILRNTLNLRPLEAKDTGPKPRGQPQMDFSRLETASRAVGNFFKSSSNGQAQPVPGDLLTLALALDSTESNVQQASMIELAEQIHASKLSDPKVIPLTLFEQEQEELDTVLRSSVVPNALQAYVPANSLFKTVWQKINESFKRHCIESSVFVKRFTAHVSVLSQTYELNLAKAPKKAADFDWMMFTEEIQKETFLGPYLVEYLRKPAHQDKLRLLALKSYDLHIKILTVLTFRLIVVFVLNHERYPEIFNKRKTKDTTRVFVHEISILASLLIILICKLTQFRSHHTCMLQKPMLKENLMDVARVLTSYLPSHFCLNLLRSSVNRNVPSKHTLTRAETNIMHRWDKQIPSFEKCTQLIHAYETLSFDTD